jgi:hypothetical protein
MLFRIAAPAYAAVLAGLALGRGPAGAELHGFHTPSGNIGCIASDEGGRWELRCDIAEKTWNGGSAGRDCDLDSGDALGVSAAGRPYWVCHGDTVLRQGRALPYGATWAAGPFTCTSAQTGLTCHGFFLSRGSYRLF